MPLQSEADFDLWQKAGRDFRLYLKVSGVCIVFMCIRNLRVLTTQFPAFGVLFATIRKARWDLTFFFLVKSPL